MRAPSSYSWAGLGSSPKGYGYINKYIFIKVGKGGIIFSLRFATFTSLRINNGIIL